MTCQEQLDDLRFKLTFMFSGNVIYRRAVSCGESVFLRAIKNLHTRKSILRQYGDLHNLWDTPLYTLPGKPLRFTIHQGQEHCALFATD